MQLVDPRRLQPAAAAEAEQGEVRRGQPLPLGAHEAAGGVNFAFFSRHAGRVRLELFDRPDDATPSRSFDLDPVRHRTGDIWHVWLAGIGAGQLYAYRADGPWRPDQGLRFNVHRLLLDPCATAIVTPPQWNFAPARDGGGPDPPANDDAAAMAKCVVSPAHFDWQDDQPPRHPWSQTLIYETHVRGFTCGAAANVAHPGSYRGLMEKIPYLQDLGITAVELMPVQQFNEHQGAGTDPLTGAALTNYWGYEPVGFFAPQASYGSAAGRQTLEFKTLVRALHRAGIEAILDVVFNHTAEGNERGPTLSWRGIDNAIFYLLADDRRYYRDYSGTGNTLNANHPVVRDHILDALRHWVLDMHVDGFRFDLAAILGRDESGRLQADAPLLERIAEDPILRDVKLIAEAWDAAGAYEVGSFSERRWSEWNGRYRDDMRRFWRGDDGLRGVFASRICGSEDIYAASGKGPECSVNFITCHDGFTLNDLVSYARKHNEANGEGNRDGSNDNFSANWGVEGASHDPAIEALRERQMRNFLLTLLISRGVPMLQGGDEFRRSQGGNNNAYCQDNATSWVDWRLLDAHRDLHRFVRGLIGFRRAHPVLSAERFYTPADVQWFDLAGRWPDWSDARAKQLACLLRESDGGLLYLMFNAGGEAADFHLPAADWRLVADTGRGAPQDFNAAGSEPPVDAARPYPLAAHASAILLAKSI